MSLRNLNNLRQTGAPSINQVFQNNNSQFIVQKYLSQSASNKYIQRSSLGESRHDLSNLYFSSNSIEPSSLDVQ